ncbi:MFS transporter, partial [Streptomyces sp. TRM76130]|nr:MFS transporter [Streptomyces sp. TRM76130]
GSEAIAVAVFGSLLASLAADRSSTDPAGGYDSAFHTLLWAMAVVCLVLGVLVITLNRGSSRTAQAG